MEATFRAEAVMAFRSYMGREAPEQWDWECVADKYGISVSTLRRWVKRVRYIENFDSRTGRSNLPLMVLELRPRRQMAVLRLPKACIIEGTANGA